MSFLRRHVIAIIVLILLCGGVAFYVYSRPPAPLDIEMTKVARDTLIQIVEETGTVKAPADASLSFEWSGSVRDVLVAEGQHVNAGDVLVRLDEATPLAELREKRAALALEVATLADLRANASATIQQDGVLSLTQKQQDALTRNAYITLLSSDLVVEPSSDDYSQTPPIITGRYDGPEGTYKVVIDYNGTYTGYVLSIFGPETVRDVEIKDNLLAPFGTHGLFISFPEDVGDYFDTVWHVSIPNKKSSSYLANYNAYVAAKESADTTVVQTKVTEEKILAQEARVAQAEAAVHKAQVRLDQYTLCAPFDGMITDVIATEGEAIVQGTLVISMIASGEPDIELYVPEANIAHVTVGDHAEVAFDAYEGVSFEAVVTAVAPSVEIVDDVASLKTTLAFLTHDPRIRVGLSADVDIFAEERVNVLTVPSRAVLDGNGGGVHVRQFRNGSLVEIPVQVGLRDSSGHIEIVSGIAEGQEVVTFIAPETLRRLEEMP